MAEISPTPERLESPLLMDAIRIRGARQHNLQNVSLRPPPQQAHRHHRRVRVGEVLARLRHDLRRRAAALRGVPLGLRPAVPRADGEAGRRLDRGPVAGDLDRAADDLAESPVDRRHGDRDLRLSPAALCLDRAAALPEVRPAHPGPDRPGDGRPGAAAASRQRSSWSSLPTCPGRRASTRSRWPRWSRRASCAPGSTASSWTSTIRRSSTSRRSTRSRSSSTVWSSKPGEDEEYRKRLADSIETATRVSGGLIVLSVADGPEEILSANYACPDCGTSLTEVTPRLFSFNSPYGACPACSGLGTNLKADPERLVVDAVAVDRGRRHRDPEARLDQLALAADGDAREALQVPPRPALREAVEGRAERHPLRLGRRRDQVLLRRREGRVPLARRPSRGSSR